ncbi:ceramide transfer protein isoform X3 [Octopus sinensis]|uniref:Ceramide transfer protein n=1 Tax=Octopus sinensis TaxID=2607531 RepID=A0A6P7TIZ9_9MOLL|nr:ceramide transfer protein isoform X3 [Octopus sinensis]
MSEERDVLSITDDEENDEFEDEGHLPEKHGTLSKWTNYLHGWQDRYVVLKDGTFSYFKSASETAYGCRGAVSLNRACVTPHPFDECRFDVSVNDNVWYLRAKDVEERKLWVGSIELHKEQVTNSPDLASGIQPYIHQAESGYGSENSLKRHGSLLSLTSGTSLSTASASSFKRGRGLREKLAEMETFRDILCRQVDTLQSYFDSCASAVAEGTVHDLTEHDDDIDDIDDYDTPTSGSSHPSKIGGLKGRDLASILQQHGGHAPDFKGEAYTFKATTAGIIATLSHCIEIMSQREDAWRKRMEREVEKRKKVEESYKSVLLDRQKPIVFGGPDYEEGPHCAINEDEFFDAVDAALDKLEKEEERKLNPVGKPMPPPAISLSPNHSLYNEINQITGEHLNYLEEKNAAGEEDNWILIHEEGEMKVLKRELEEDGLVIDPLKAVHTVKGITGHEICHYFWDLNVRMDWEGTLESTRCIEWLSEDTFVSHNVIKRVWPASQRDALFWSHIRHVISDDEEKPDLWIVVNYSTDHPSVPPNKYVRVKMNVSMACQTLIEPPNDSEITRDNITCKITYTANVNPGGWAPASVLRAVYKREYPKFLKRFTSYVKEITANKPILL